MRRSSACASKMSVYLDYNATCPLAPEVLEAITTALRDGWANPSSSHVAGKLARGFIDKAREQVARMINCHAEDILFTSGGTESNNMVLTSALRFWGNNKGKGKPHIITSNVEHDSVAKCLERLEKDGQAEVTVVGASRENGAVGVGDVMAAIKPSTVLISIMLAQNETGVLQPVRELVKAVKEFEASTERRRRIFIHTDAAQVLGKVKVNVEEMEVDYLTIVGHKFYGPRVGALYCRGLGGNLMGDPLLRGAPLTPLLWGGGQERGLRSGTENTGMIAGLGKACELVADNVDSYHDHMQTVRNYLEQRLKDTFGENVCFNCCHGNVSERLPNTSNFSLVGTAMTGPRVMAVLKKTQVSVGAACHSPSEDRPSPILLASGVTRGMAVNALRVSVGRETTTSDIDTFISDLVGAREAIHGDHVTSHHN